MFGRLNNFSKKNLVNIDFIVLLSLMIIDGTDNVDYFIYKFNISKKDMRKGAKQFEEMWSVINEENKDSLYTKLKPCNSTKFLQRRTRDLKLSNEIMELCKEVCTYVEKEDYLIKHIPLSITAGCIYFTCEYLKIPVNKNDFKLDYIFTEQGIISAK